jgi:hypothetical protein
MTYLEQLRTKEWKEKRIEILERDNCKCAKCKCERPKYIGYLKSFGIKTFYDMQKEGYNLFLRDSSDSILFMVTKTRIASLERAMFIGELEKELEPNNLYYAKRWIESDDSNNQGKVELICFKEKITIDQIYPDLNIHHKYYVIDKYAWEYDNTALITLCYKCHQLEHENNVINVYAQSGGKLYIAERCNKCNGSGYLPMYDYFHNGICFSCEGRGVILNENQGR